MLTINKLWVLTRYVIVGIVSIGLSGFSLASIILKQPIPDHTRLSVLPYEDVLSPSSANHLGHSITQFSSFSTNRPLKIFNPTNRAPANGRSANLIIIEADSVQLRSHIEIVGETADLLIVAKGGGAVFSCTSCSFSNIGRLTLATVTPTFDGNRYPLTLKPTASSMSINGLNTESVASLELVGNTITLNGTINTQLKGSRLFDGTYQVNPNGNLVIGAGGVNIFNGLTVKYADLQVSDRNASSSLTINQNTKINSQAIQVTTARPFVMNGIINTKSDAATVANYRGNISAVEESIKIYSLDTTGTLAINGIISSDNVVDIRSSSNLNLNGHISANGLIAIAGNNHLLTHNNKGSIYIPGRSARWDISRSKNHQKITSQACSQGQYPSSSDLLKICVSAFLSGGRIENNGLIKAKSVVAASINELQNRYGGVIIADNIQLSSQKSFVRNGSRYPFKPADDRPLVFAPVDKDDIPLGTVMIDDQPFLDAMNGAGKVNTAALILGKEITVVAADNIENINPYVEVTRNPSGYNSPIKFSNVKASQVQMVAENYLGLNSNSYVLNSSAHLGVSGSKGQLLISSPAIANQRYSTQAVIQPYQRKEGNVTLTGDEVAMMVYSPPGILYSFSELSFNLGASGSFINNTSYFEVLNNAFISSNSQNQIINIGINLNSTITQALDSEVKRCQDRLSQVSTAARTEAESRAAYNEYSNCLAKVEKTNYVAGTVLEAQEGTLFSVKGNFNANKTNFSSTNHNVSELISSKALNDHLTAIKDSLNASRSQITQSIPTSNGGNVRFDYIVESVFYQQNGSTTSLVAQRRVTSVDYSYCTGNKSDCRNYVQSGTVFQQRQGAQKSLEQTMKELYAELKASLMNAIDKLLALIS